MWKADRTQMASTGCMQTDANAHGNQPHKQLFILKHAAVHGHEDHASSKGCSKPHTLCTGLAATKELCTSMKIMQAANKAASPTDYAVAWL